MWTVPHDRNPYFTGREQVLASLHASLSAARTTALVQAEVLSGLGGVGKTQTALEYAYRFREEYKAVFWLEAETDLVLRASYRKLASVLGLPDLTKDEAEGTIRLVRHWLEDNPGWLLILDNATDADSLRPFLPRGSAGHVLITSRASVFDSLGVTSPVQLDPMEPDEALDLLLARTGREESQGDERAAAVALVEELGRLPLAIEQAGVYILRKKAAFAEYLKGFRERPIALLDKAPPIFGLDAKTVSKTWQINFEQVRAESQVAADLLCFSAFLSPAPIPFDLIKSGAPELGPDLAKALEGVAGDPLLLKELLEPLHRYSLIGLDVNADSYTIHRLVQQVVRYSLPEEDVQTWTNRTIDAFSRAFWETDEHHWMSWAALIPHASDLVARYGDTGEHEGAGMAQILVRLGDYQIHTGQYSLAERNLAHALRIHEGKLDGKHPGYWRSLNDYGLVLYRLGRTNESLSFGARALRICEETLGSEHSDTATCLGNLGLYYSAQGRHAQAQALEERALEIYEKALGPEHPDTASSLGNLASYHSEQGRHAQAQALEELALEIRKKALGPEHPDTATSLGNLALFHGRQGRHSEAESLAERALQVREMTLGSEHPETATGLEQLADTCWDLKRFESVQSLLQRAGQIHEKSLGLNHRITIRVQRKLAVVSTHLRQWEEANRVLSKVHTGLEALKGKDHPDFAELLREHAKVMRALGRRDAAKRMEARASEIEQKHGLSGGNTSSPKVSNSKARNPYLKRR